MSATPIRVLIVDDDALVRDMLSQGLSEDPGLDVVGTAADAYEARDKIVRLRPDVLTLDVEMPKMNGIEFLRRLIPQYPIPVVLVSSHSRRGERITMEALEAGAVDFLPKPKSGGQSRAMMVRELATKLKIAATAQVGAARARPGATAPAAARVPANVLQRGIVAIGASTGGTEALHTVLSGLPAEVPGIVIVQHMPAHFTKAFAERLDQLCRIRVKEAQTGDPVVPGQALLAPGGLQMQLRGHEGRYHVVCRPDGPVNGHCPSVDVLMYSVAKRVTGPMFGVILTGMGNDGAAGLKAMHEAGATTLAQDEKTSVVYGMPRAAHLAGAVERLLPLNEIAPALLYHFASNRKRATSSRPVA